MSRANLSKELIVEVADKPGLFSEVASAIAEAGVNITAICAYAVSDKAFFRLLTSDNAKAKNSLVKKGFKVEEKEVVTVILEDEIGQAKELSLKLKESKVNLYSLYGTTCSDAGAHAFIVMGSKDPQKVISSINK